MAFKSGGTVNVDTAKLSKDVHRLRVDVNDHFNNHPTVGVGYDGDIRALTDGFKEMGEIINKLQKELDTMHRWRRAFEEDPLKLIRTTTNNFVLDLDKGKKKEEPEKKDEGIDMVDALHKSYEILTERT